MVAGLQIRQVYQPRAFKTLMGCCLCGGAAWFPRVAQGSKYNNALHTAHVDAVRRQARTLFSHLPLVWLRQIVAAHRHTRSVAETARRSRLYYDNLDVMRHDWCHGHEPTARLGGWWCRLALTRRSGRSSVGTERSSPSVMRAATTLWGGHELPRHPGCRRRLAAGGGDLGHRRGRSVAVAEASYQQDGSGPGVTATAAAPAAVAPAAVAPAAAAPQAEALTEYGVEP